MAAYVEFYIDQGANFENVINLSDDSTNTPINVTNYVITSQMRRSHYSTNITANISCVVTNAAAGEVTMRLLAKDTAKIKAGRYVFDVKSTDRANVTSRILEGIITVTPQVTK